MSTSGTASEELWRPLPWQQDLWLDLTALVLQNHLSHALLLSGPAGVGKHWFARALSAFILCEQRSGYACGRCRSCAQIAVGAHPNASVLGTDGLFGMALSPTGQHENGLVHWQPESDRARRDISIEAVRQLISRLALSSHYQGARVALIEHADALNSSSVNALLKTVEEPPSAMHLILVSERPQALPATLRSRCQRIRVAPPRTETTSPWLDACLGYDASAALAAAGGAPLRAIELAQGDGVAQRDQWAELWTAVGRRRKDPIAAAATVGRDALIEHLGWAWDWIGTQLREQVLTDDGDVDRCDALQQMLSEVTDALRKSRGNAQPQLLLESLLVEWLRLAPAALGLQR